MWSSHNHSIDAPMLCTLVGLERCPPPSLLDYRLLLWLWLVYRGVWMHPRSVLSWYLLGLRPSWLWFGLQLLLLGDWACVQCDPSLLGSWSLHLDILDLILACAWGINTEALKLGNLDIEDLVILDYILDNPWNWYLILNLDTWPWYLTLILDLNTRPWYLTLILDLDTWPGYLTWMTPFYTQPWKSLDIKPWYLTWVTPFTWPW